MKGFKIGDQVIAYGNSESSYCGTIIGRRRNGYYELSVIDEETIVIRQCDRTVQNNWDNKPLLRDQRLDDLLG